VKTKDNVTPILAALMMLLLVLLCPSVVLARVQALFSLDTPAGGPFPSNRFAVGERKNNTGIAVAMPKPDCVTRTSDCQLVDVINTLDGFNVQPRLSIPFDGPIDVASVSTRTVFLLRLGDAREEESDRDRGDGDDGDVSEKRSHAARQPARIIGINYVVWDPPTNTLHGESDALLEQHTRYALVVTAGIRDTFGAPVEASTAFRAFIDDGHHGHDLRLEAYRRELVEALEVVRRVGGVSESHIVSLSVFTTQSVTAILEKIRDQLAATPLPHADFGLGTNGMRTVFPLQALQSFTSKLQVGTAPVFSPGFESLRWLATVSPGFVDTIAFGKYRSVIYLVPGEYIPEVGTRSGVPVPQREEDIYFNLYLPVGSMPSQGWPVAIYGHGGGGSKLEGDFVAGVMASAGIATIAINAVGHGQGPLGTFAITRKDGTAITFPSGGRGIDQNGNGTIGGSEGLTAAPPRGSIDIRDGTRQTVVDLMQLVRTIQAGVDVDGDGLPDLDPSRIYFFGPSLGALYGTLLVAVEPSVRAGVIVEPGNAVEFYRLSPSARVALGANFATRVPPLINVGGIVFNENIPLRDRPPVINDVTGAMALQEWFDFRRWVSQAGNAAAYAPYLRKQPLRGVPGKRVIIQFVKGDQTAPNPTTSTLIRAGDLEDRATFFRYDLVFEAFPTIPKNPHPYLLPLFVAPQVDPFALATQKQIAIFFATDGDVTIDPDGSEPIFEVPIVLPLPEDLSFIP